ncbi:universal stress protein [Janibacter melonis]|mgnify:CR=1 FL=1|uniref:Universal stress protein n=1 Tax=Janibacter melonis TaxID=262209 RepID=A0A5P8FNB9_9MICO|nr:universal stress protein [Janibacter melonis]MBD5830027.1 universal stress protein [Janibacter melonis]MCB5990515.1 universal stress protein [Janibacter melonis]QFQ30434.2 universal stress protein [Janibacter melonis]
MTIVVGYVSTKEGRAALDRAVEEAKLRGRRLVVVHSDRGGSGFTGDNAASQEATLQGVRDDLAGSGVDVDVRGLVRGKEPAEDLIAVAEETDAELIVIGLRRRTPVGKLILGSNAQRVLLDAPCPVLAVKADA